VILCVIHTGPAIVPETLISVQLTSAAAILFVFTGFSLFLRKRLERIRGTMKREPQIEITLSDVIEGGHEPPLSVSSQGLVRRYREKYVVKTRDTAEQVRRELRFLETAGECAVDVIGIITRDSTHALIGFIMPLELVINPSALDEREKFSIFKQMKRIVPELHEKGIIHGDIKLSNMLVTAQHRLILCDFGTAAFVDEMYYPRAISVRWSSPYRLRSPNARLISKEDIYGLGIAVWELFTGRIPFGEIDSDDEEVDLEEVIRSGETVDVVSVENCEAQNFIKQCLAIFDV
jgi:serine/threonine protein kinase